jgi:hypothetical protein
MTTRMTLHLDCDIWPFNLLLSRLPLAGLLVVTSRAFAFGGGRAWACVLAYRGDSAFLFCTWSNSCTSAAFRWSSQWPPCQSPASSGATAVSWTSICCSRHRPGSGARCLHRQESRSCLGFWFCRGWGGTAGSSFQPIRPS